MIMDRVDAIFMSGDFDGWKQSVALPLTFESRKGTQFFTSEDDLRADFELYQKEFAIHRVTDLARIVKSAELVGSDMMVGTYRAHVLHNGTNVVPPWDSGITLKRQDGLWRVTKIMRALGHLDWTTSAQDNDSAGTEEHQETEASIIRSLSKDTPTSGRH